MDPVILVLEDVTIRYADRLAVDRVSLEIRRGEILGLLGPNGSGKSSTLAAIAGELQPASGRVRLLGLDPFRQPLDHRRRLGFVPQELAVYEEMSAEDNLLFFGRLYGLRRENLRRRVDEVLRFVGLSAWKGALVATYSGGMKRRLNLACALLHEPALLLLDEPTVGLDIESRDAIFASLRTLRERGCAMIFTTHNLDETEVLCDRIAFMKQGKLVAVDRVERIVQPGLKVEQAYLHWTGGRRAA